MPGTISSMSNSFPVGLESTHDLLPLGKSGILAHTGLSSSAPDRIRTCDLRFRRPVVRGLPSSKTVSLPGISRSQIPPPFTPAPQYLPVRGADWGAESRDPPQSLSDTVPPTVDSPGHGRPARPRLWEVAAA